MVRIWQHSEAGGGAAAGAGAEGAIQEGDMDQQSAMEELRERYARGGLPLDEFRRVMGQLMVTTDPAECQAILDALPAEPEQPRAVSAPLPATSRPLATSSRPGRPHHISALFGEADRTGAL